MACQMKSNLNAAFCVRDAQGTDNLGIWWLRYTPVQQPAS